MTTGWRIAARDDYLAALGRAVFNFGYLQWVVETTTGLLAPGYPAAQQPVPAAVADITTRFSRAARQCQFLDAPDHQLLIAQVDSFKALVGRRNDLIRGHPLTEDAGIQEIHFGGSTMSVSQAIALADQAARDFEAAAVEIHNSSWRLRGTVEALRTIVRGTSWLMNALHVLAAIEPEAWIAAGAIRNTVWDHLHHQPARSGSDVDVVLYAPADERVASRIRDRLVDVAPHLDWEVVNQATAHQWLSQHLGRPIEPLQSLAQGLASWPETATAVAVRLNAQNAIEVMAPFGLADLMQMQLRPNPGCPDASAFARRVKEKNFLGRWRRLTLHPPVA